MGEETMKVRQAKVVKAIVERVRPTICPTFSSRGGETIEGRITGDDFDALLGVLVEARIITAEDAQYGKAPATARQN